MGRDTSSFVPPAPGSWELEQTHLTKPPSTFLGAIFPEAMVRGFKEGTRHYGALLSHLDVALVQRFVYVCPRPVGAPKAAKGPPPRPLFALLRRLHPEIRRRVARASETFRDRIWRDDLRLWDTEVKPSIKAEAKALRAEDLVAMTVEALAGHAARAAAFLGKTIYWHHRFNLCNMVPLGDLLAHVQEWGGVPPHEVLQALRGASPASAGALEEMVALREALAGDAEATAILESDQPAGQIVAALASRPTPVGPAARAYLDEAGTRVLGSYDPAEKLGREQPDVLVKILRSLTSGRADVERTTASAAAAAALRARMPEARRPLFDELFAEALLTYRIRDERNFDADALGSGIARRALLEAGRRLAERGAVAEPEHLAEATPDEVQALLLGRGGPSAGELAARARFRQEAKMSEAPERLGIPPSAPPPADWLPRDAARLQRAVAIVLELMFAARQERQGKKLTGFAASAGRFEGPARVVSGPEELHLVRQGEVLVASSTSPSFNLVLPLLGAIVTERGGALCHAAIVAREYGLPAVVGCGGALSAVTSGDRVRVDGDTGEMWILGPS